MIVLLIGSNARIDFILASDKTIERPVSSGTLPPLSPVLPPWGTMATRCSRHQRITAATDSVVSGMTTASACPRILLRQSIRWGAMSSMAVNTRPWIRSLRLGNCCLRFSILIISSALKIRCSLFHKCPGALAIILALSTTRQGFHNLGPRCNFLNVSTAQRSHGSLECSDG